MKVVLKHLTKIFPNRTKNLPDVIAVNDYDFEIPSILTSVCAKEQEKIEYVQSVIRQITRKEIRKPVWMSFIELNMSCNEFGQAPSTFLQIEAKEPHYEALAQRLIEFLYSPNLTITMVKA